MVWRLRRELSMHRRLNPMRYTFHTIRTRIVRKLIAVALLLSPFTLSAQEFASIVGNVYDAVTGEALPFASVFVNNTTIGTTADTLGHYRLSKIPVTYSDVIFSFIGYESLLVKVMLTPGKETLANAKLFPSKRFLKQVTISDKVDKQWRKNYERFQREFFGTTQNAALCEITNIEVLDFFTDDNFNFHAVAHRPLEVYNHALGYKLQVSLKSFLLKEKESRISYYVNFAKLPPKNERERVRWQIGRLKSFKGSPRHFLQCLIQQRTEKEGYRIYYDVTYKLHADGARKQVLAVVPRQLLTPKADDEPDSKDYYRLLQKGDFEIHYLNEITPKIKRVYADFPHPVSWIKIPGEYLLCSSNGTLKPNSTYMVSGDMSGYRIANILPQDYDPVTEEGTILLDNYSRRGTIKGVVKAASDSTALKWTQIFINNTLRKATSDSLGNFKITNVPVGIYELVATNEGHDIYHQKIQVFHDSTVSANVLMAETEGDSRHDSIPDDQKGRYFTRAFLKGKTSLRILNPDALEVGLLSDGIYFHAKRPIRLRDSRNGYQLRYIFHDVIVREDQTEIQGYVSFDTLIAKNSRIREKWLKNRYQVYHGSMNHFLKALVNGRSKEEGFDVTLTREPTDEEIIFEHHRLSDRIPQQLEVDTLIVNNEEGMSALNLPPGTIVRFEKGKPSQVKTIPGLQISPLGTLSSSEGLICDGPFKQRIIPLLPLDYQPLNETIHDPRVWEFVNNKRRGD
jgi:hypothetical protein